MHAIRLHEFGPPEHLRYEEVDDPVPGAGQVRIAVAVAGVHLIDTAIRAGRRMGPMPLPSLPAIPGREVAGAVDAVGAGVDEGWLGRRVVAHLGPASGGYAELALCDAGSLHALPDGLGDDAAVAMIGTGRTALAILEVAQIGADDVVLVTAAAGGIGALVVQATRDAGALVVGAAGGTEKLARVRELGADAAAPVGRGAAPDTAAPVGRGAAPDTGAPVGRGAAPDTAAPVGRGAVIAVDYNTPAWPDAVRAALGGREVTVALDGVGGELGRAALELLGPGGRLIVYGLASGAPTQLSIGDLFSRGLTVSAAIGPHIQRRPGGMRGLEDEALATAAAGRLQPLIGRPFPLEQAAAAHATVEARATVGKTVLTT